MTRATGIRGAPVETPAVVRRTVEATGRGAYHVTEYTGQAGRRIYGEYTLTRYNPAAARISLRRRCCREAAMIHVLQDEEAGIEREDGETFRCPDEDCRRIAVWRRGAWREQTSDEPTPTP